MRILDPTVVRCAFDGAKRISQTPRIRVIEALFEIAGRRGPTMTPQVGAFDKRAAGRTGIRDNNLNSTIARASRNQTQSRGGRHLEAPSEFFFHSVGGTKANAGGSFPHVHSCAFLGVPDLRRRLDPRKPHHPVHKSRKASWERGLRRCRHQNKVGRPKGYPAPPAWVVSSSPMSIPARS